MSSSLPPGVTESMIPGNRPEDMLYDQIWEKLEVMMDAFLIEVDNMIEIETTKAGMVCFDMESARDAILHWFVQQDDDD